MHFVNQQDAFSKENCEKTMLSYESQNVLKIIGKNTIAKSCIRNHVIKKSSALTNYRTIFFYYFRQKNIS